MTAPCQKCGDPYPSADLCSDGLCVRCYDKVPGYDEEPRHPLVLLTDEERQRRVKERKRVYRSKNKDKIAAAQRRFRNKPVQVQL